MIASLTSRIIGRIFSTANVNFYRFPLNLLPDIPAPTACPLGDHLECPALMLRGAQSTAPVRRIQADLKKQSLLLYVPGKQRSFG